MRRSSGRRHNDGLSATGFLRAEQGAVTVDWVVLSAAIVGMGVLAVLGVRSGSEQMAAIIDTALSDAAVVVGDVAPARGDSGDADPGLTDTCTAMTPECGFHDPAPNLGPLRPAPPSMPGPDEFVTFPEPDMLPAIR